MALLFMHSIAEIWPTLQMSNAHGSVPLLLFVSILGGSRLGGKPVCCFESMRASVCLTLYGAAPSPRSQLTDTSTQLIPATARDQELWLCCWPVKLESVPQSALAAQSEIKGCVLTGDGPACLWRSNNTGNYMPPPQAFASCGHLNSLTSQATQWENQCQGEKGLPNGDLHIHCSMQFRQLVSCQCQRLLRAAEQSMQAVELRTACNYAGHPTGLTAQSSDLPHTSATAPANAIEVLSMKQFTGHKGVESWFQRCGGETPRAAVGKSGRGALRHAPPTASADETGPGARS